jgi:hypothetical protein
MIPIATMVLCTAVLLFSSRQAVAQTPAPKVSADWQALGWTLPESFSPDQIALFKGLNAARGTWSFVAETVDGDTTTALTGNLVATGGSQGAWHRVGA